MSLSMSSDIWSYSNLDAEGETGMRNCETLVGFLLFLFVGFRFVGFGETVIKTINSFGLIFATINQII